MAVLVETLSHRPRTLRTVARRRGDLRHDIEVAGTARARPPRGSWTWRSALILLLLNLVLITLAMRWDGFFSWW